MKESFPVKTQSRTQTPQASWSSGGCQERLWGTGIVSAGILRLTVFSFVTVNDSEHQSKTNQSFSLP